MALDPSNSSNLEQLALKGLSDSFPIASPAYHKHAALRECREVTSKLTLYEGCPDPPFYGKAVIWTHRRLSYNPPICAFYNGDIPPIMPLQTYAMRRVWFGIWALHSNMPGAAAAVAALYDSVLVKSRSLLNHSAAVATYIPAAYHWD